MSMASRTTMLNTCDTFQRNKEQWDEVLAAKHVKSESEQHALNDKNPRVFLDISHGDRGVLGE
jgi:hypothetical protein